MKNLAFHSLLSWQMIIVPILITSHIHFSLEGLGECTFWTLEWKVKSLRKQCTVAVVQTPFSLYMLWLCCTVKLYTNMLATSIHLGHQITADSKSCGLKTHCTNYLKFGPITYRQSTLGLKRSNSHLIGRIRWKICSDYVMQTTNTL